jgi:PAS domain S-box-containing protein
MSSGEANGNGSAGLLSAIFEQADAGLCLLAPDGTVLRASAAWLRATGCTREEALGRPALDLLPEVRERLAPLHARALAGEKVEVPRHARSVGGRETWWAGSVAPVPVLGGTGLLVTLREVSAEVSREEAERQSQSLYDLAPVGVVLSDAAGRILSFNRHAHEQLGYGHDEFAALTMAQIDALDVPGDFEARVAAIQDGATSIEFETRHRGRSGEEREMLVRSRLVQDGGELRVLSVWADLTQERRSMRALEESERWLRESERISRVGHYVLEIDSDRWTSSEVLDEIFGIDGSYRRDTAGWLALIHPGDREGMAAHLSHVMITGSRFDREYRVLTPGGDERWVHGLGDLLFDLEDRPTRMFGTIQDVTRRHQAEQALRESEARLSRSEERYRLLADHATDVIWTYDLRARGYTYVSPAIFRLRGVTVEEALAERLEDALTPESLARFREVLGRIGTPQEEDPHTGIYAQPCRDGSVRHVEMTTTFIRDDRFVPVEVVGVSRDATARIAAEEALRRSERRFRTLIERSTDVIVLVDRARRVSFWSPSAAEALGFSADEALGKDLGDLTHPDDRARAVEFLDGLLARPGETARITLRLQHRDGSWRALDSLCRNLLGDPAVEAIVVNTRDVTDQLRLEEQFHQAQKLESVGRLAGGVAHDFNNLLTVILSCSEALKQDLPDADPVALEDLEEIHAAGLRARDLTRQLLAFARKQVIAPVELDVSAVVKGSEKLLRRVLGEDIELTVEAAPGLWPVHADPGQVEQVLVNLAVNARDAMPRGGKLAIETRNVEVSADEAAAGGGARPGSWVGVRVRDTGAGMTPEVKAHLFEPFFTTKEQGRGSGLGLATVHGITAQAGGVIRVESEPGRGTTFEILFPRSTAAPAAQAAERPGHPPRGHDTVLVIEDDAQVRSVTVRALRDAGYRVLVAADGGEALEVAARQDGPLDLVVTDVVMPGLSGRAVVEELQRRQPALRALYVSGYTQDTIAQRGVLEAGVQFLPKPFTASSLLSRVREVLDAG